VRQACKDNSAAIVKVIVPPMITVWLGETGINDYTIG
jgi:hypothetical protein